MEEEWQNNDQYDDDAHQQDAIGGADLIRRLQNGRRGGFLLQDQRCICLLRKDGWLVKTCQHQGGDKQENQQGKEAEITIYFHGFVRYNCNTRLKCII
jgi:hypothetical protein